MLIMIGDRVAISTAKISSGNRTIPQKFCDVCQHTVHDLVKHYQTGDHLRNLRRNGGSSARPDRVAVRASKLTPRQMEVLRLVMGGNMHCEVASLLGVKVRTVKKHVVDARCRLKARNTTHAVVIALREGYISLDGKR